MKGLFVKNSPVECDRLGNPRVDSFLELLLPDPAGRGDREKARKATTLDYIENLDDFVKKVAKRIDTEEQHIWEVISFDERKKERKKKVKRHRIILHNDDYLEEEDPIEDYHEEDDSIEDYHKEDDLTGKSLEVNSQVLSSLAALIRETNPDVEYEYYALLKDTTLPFIKAIKQHGPLLDNSSNGRNQPEKPNEILFGVSQRAEQLHMNLSGGRVAQVGKRALELYRQEYPGYNPPQRTVKNDHGHEYLMNQYSETTAKRTLDIALKEEKKRQRE